jgi:hypothetical protein
MSITIINSSGRAALPFRAAEIVMLRAECFIGVVTYRCTWLEPGRNI